ncbi:MAG TPA: hypothetical protein VFQ65_20645 [Kofleriaceae bacterium]|nr:hypothetical protein [Kofleriaceae bacterium]
MAVVPGYVKCPKCHRALPRYSRNSVSPVGGTAVETPASKASPVFALLVAALVGGGIIWFFINRKHNASAAAPAPATETLNGSASAQVAPAVAPPPTPTPAPVQPSVHADQVAKNLETDLKKQRLWSTVSVTGDHVDVHSSSCNDAAMKATIQPQLASFHEAGLTKLRCLEQSGAVVFARDL